MIAVIEDDEAMRVAVRRLLESEGFEAATYASAEAFLDSPDPRGIDCLVLDIHLPGLSGLDLYRQLAAKGSTAPAIFMTGHDSERTRREAALLPCAYLVKPFGGDALLHALRDATDHASGPA